MSRPYLSVWFFCTVFWVVLGFGGAALGAPDLGPSLKEAARLSLGAATALILLDMWDRD